MKNSFESDITNQFSMSITKLFTTIISSGFEVTLVGGVTRDFFLYGQLAKDIDCEIRYCKEITDENWSKTLDLFFEKIAQVKKLSFGVYRICLEGYELEFSSPRTETFAVEGNGGHSDFTAKLSSNYSYTESFKRRDFTINAIGLKLSLKDSKLSSSLIDPYDGTLDLKNKQLSLCSEDFFKDPVRLLRLVRFKIQHSLEINENIRVNFKKFNLIKLTKFYFFKEGIKVSLSEYVKELFQIIKKNNITTNMEILKFEGLGNLTLCPAKTTEELLFQIIYSDSSQELSFAEISSWLSLKKAMAYSFSIQKKSLINLVALSSSSLNLKIKDALCSNNEDLIKSSLFKELAIYWEQKQRFPTANYKVCNSDLDKVHEELKILYAENLLGEREFILGQKNYKNEFKQIFKIICHFREFFNAN